LRLDRIIDRLRAEKDPLIKQFTKDELQPIMNDNRYHSQEESETDSEQPRGERKIVIKDLPWRSSTVSLLFVLFGLFVLYIPIGNY
jgi:hypothetical protein